MQLKGKKVLNMRRVYLINLYGILNDKMDDKTIEDLRYIAAVSGSSFSQIAEAFEQLCSIGLESAKSIGDIFRDIEEMVDTPDDIITLKKQIKYCKNPMEIKALNKRLNDAYKKKSKNKKR